MGLYKSVTEKSSRSQNRVIKGSYTHFEGAHSHVPDGLENDGSAFSIKWLYADNVGLLVRPPSAWIGIFPNRDYRGTAAEFMEFSSRAKSLLALKDLAQT